MDVFFVDGSEQCLADIILKNIVSGKTCSVASYGFGVKQVRRLIDAFDQVLLVADISHSQLNAKAYDAVVEMSDKLPHFIFRPIKTHAKLALIDDEIVIFTSANLSANRRIESYMIGRFEEVTGIDEIKKTLGDPGSIFKKSIEHSKDLFGLGDLELLEFDLGDIGV